MMPLGGVQWGRGGVVWLMTPDPAPPGLAQFKAVDQLAGGSAWQNKLCTVARGSVVPTCGLWVNLGSAPAH